MKTLSALISLLCLSALILLGGCGGGGSSSPAPAASRATVKLSTQGTLASGTQLAGIQVKITLPAGVTVDTQADGTTVAAGVVTVSGVAAGGVSTPAIYTPATATTPGTLEFTIAAPNFGTGEFATVVLNIAGGSRAPTASEVTISPADQTLHPVTTLTVALAAS